MSNPQANLGERPPLKDTSKHFVNTPTTSKLLAAPSISLKKNSKQHIEVQKLDTSEYQQQQLSHTQKLTTSDRAPYLVDTSTPKKDGYLPSLSTRNVINPSAPKLTATENTNNNATTATINTVFRKMSGNELSRWRQTWREILPKSHIYFENDISNLRDKQTAILALKNLGATIEPFFGENVTIIVSRRRFDKGSSYATNDIFRYANKKQLKVWNLEKVFRFLSHLGEPIPDLNEYERKVGAGLLKPGATSNSTNATNNNSNNNNNNVVSATSNVNNTNQNQPTNNTNLSNLLMNERLFGPSDRDPTVKRSDLKYFTDYYLYIFDVKQRTRPVAIREWKDKSSYPKIHHTTNGKSLFVTETKSQNLDKMLTRHERRLVYLSESAPYRESMIDACYDTPIVKAYNIHVPTYEERVQHKLDWEMSYYKTNPDAMPSVKFKKLFNSLDASERQNFPFLNRLYHSTDSENYDNDEDEDDDEDDNDVAVDNDDDDDDKYGVDDSDSNTEYCSHKRRKLSNGEYITTQLSDKNKQSDIKNNTLDSTDTGIPKTKNIEEEDCENEDYRNADNMGDDDIAKLVSDKVDPIDGINNPLTKTKESYLKKVPKFSRQDTMMNRLSQNVSADGKLLCEYGEIAASGIQASAANPSGNCSHGTNAPTAIGNGLGPSRSAVINRTLASEHKRIVVLRPTLNTKKRNRDSATTATSTANFKNNNKMTVLVADDSMSEKTQEQLLADYKRELLNEDELAALRSAEAAEYEDKMIKNLLADVRNVNKPDANPFISDGKCKPCNNNHNTANNKQIEDKVNNGATLGIFKDKKPDKSKHEMKPGYCENCRVKYSDFVEHILSEKHRSFAENDSNFKQIDELIRSLRENPVSN